MIILSLERLRRFCNDLLIEAGASKENAGYVAEHLSRSNLLGHDSHGVSCITMYLDAIGEGYIDPTATPKVIKDMGSIAVVSGSWTFGQVGAEFAAKLAIERAKQHKVAIVGAVHCNHTGRLGHYCELAAAEGVGTIITHGGFEMTFMVPPGGTSGALAANPIAFGLPAGIYPPVVVDFATTTVAVGKLAVARDEGKQVAPGLILDKAGKPTINPNDFFDGGALLPFGGHKGYGLGLAVEILAAALIGEHDISYQGKVDSNLEKTGTLFIAFDTAVFQPGDSYGKLVEGIVDRLKGIEPAPGSDGVMIPGEPELAQKERRLKDGIPIADATWARIKRAADDLGIDLPPV